MLMALLSFLSAWISESVLSSVSFSVFGRRFRSHRMDVAEGVKELLKMDFLSFHFLVVPRTTLAKKHPCPVLTLMTVITSHP